MKIKKQESIISLNSLATKEILRITKKNCFGNIKKRHRNTKLIFALFEKESIYFQSILKKITVGTNIIVEIISPIKFRHYVKNDIQSLIYTLKELADGILYYGVCEKILSKIAFHTQKPIINLETKVFAPIQALAILHNVRKKIRKLKNKTLVYIGDANTNVCRELIIASQKLKYEMIIYTDRPSNVQKKLFNFKNSEKNPQVLEYGDSTKKKIDFLVIDSLESDKQRKNISNKISNSTKEFYLDKHIQSSIQKNLLSFEEGSMCIQQVVRNTEPYSNNIKETEISKILKVLLTKLLKK